MRRLGYSLTAFAVIALVPARAAAMRHRAARHIHHHARRMSYARYRQSVRQWHTKDRGRKAPLDAHGRPELVIESINTRERVALSPMTDKGGFSASELERAAHVLRDPRTGNEFPMDPGVIDILYRLERHFKTHSIRVVSAYRTPHPGSHSRHGEGRAIDLVVPGASDRAVARFVRNLGFCGVGVYTRSGFVHVDVRARSYFWVDHSGPGRPNRAHPVLRNLAKRADQRALARGCPRPLASVRPDPDPDAVWNAHSVRPETRLSARLAALTRHQHDDTVHDHGTHTLPTPAHPSATPASGKPAKPTSADAHRSEDTSADDANPDEAHADNQAARQTAEHEAK